jgi:phospholipid transport system substrate-binding protein
VKVASRVRLLPLVLLIAAAPPGPAATLSQKNDELRRILCAPEPNRHKDEQKKLLDSLLDYDSFARQALAEHWDGLKRRDELVGVFKQMLQNRYLRQLKAHLADEVVQQNEVVDGADASVTFMIHGAGKGRESDEEVVYKLHKSGDRWRVRDIITDEVSLVRNYKTQFHKIITEQGPDKLIEKMKAKL